MTKKGKNDVILNLILFFTVTMGFVQILASHGNMTFSDNSILKYGGMVSQESSLFTVFSSLFIHVSIWHLIGNVIVFWVAMNDFETTVHNSFKINSLIFLGEALIINFVEYFIYPKGFISAGLSGLNLILVTYILSYRIDKKQINPITMAFILIILYSLIDSKNSDQFAHIFAIILGLITFFIIKFQNKDNGGDKANV